MAYITGVANSFADLKSAMITGCTANGWANPATDVLSKNNCFVKLTSAATYLKLDAGLGQSGGVLTSPTPGSVYLIDLIPGGALVFPVTYHLHVVGSGVAMVVNFATDRYIYAMFGQDPVSGLPGTGVWLTGTSGHTSLRFIQFDAICAGDMNSAQGANGTGPFWVDSCFGGNTNSYAHHGLDGGGWTNAGEYAGFDGAPNNMAKATSGMSKVMTKYGPNAWNGQAVLAPVLPYILRPSSKVSIVCDIDILRYIRLDNFASGGVLTIGAEKWKVYPMYRRNTSSRLTFGTGTNTLDHSGTLGYAVRYDGP